MLGWASGGRRRSELVALRREDLSLREFDARGVIWVSLLETKTTARGKTPRLVLKGKAAQALVHWLQVAEITEGPLFRAVSKRDRPLSRGCPRMRFIRSCAVGCAWPGIRKALPRRMGCGRAF